MSIFYWCKLLGQSTESAPHAKIVPLHWIHDPDSWLDLARFQGLFPINIGKGMIMVGGDGDIMVRERKKKVYVNCSNIQHVSSWPWEETFKWPRTCSHCCVYWSRSNYVAFISERLDVGAATMSLWQHWFCETVNVTGKGAPLDQKNKPLLMKKILCLTKRQNQ
jgi:hypothetical protein